MDDAYKTIGCGWIVWTTLVVLWAGDARAQQTRPTSCTPAELVSLLRQNSSHLFDDRQRAVLNEIETDLGRASSAPSPPGAAATAPETIAKRQATEERLVALLRDCGKRIEVSIVGGQAQTTGQMPIALGGDAGAMLLCTGAGSGANHYVTMEYDLSQTREPIPIRPPPDAGTWALVRLANVPAGRSSLLFELERPGGKSLPFTLDLAAPEPARLEVTVRSDDGGEPVPAMIQLTWKLDGSDRRPSNAVDFSGQFDNIGQATAHRHATLPGRLKDRYWWCVPGPFDMPIPPGEWEIVIRRGLEHVPVFDSFTAAPGQVVAKTYTPRRWVNMPRRGWYSGDDHVHCRITSDADAARLMAWTRAEDVHVVNVLKMGDVYRTWYQQRGFGAAYRVAQGDYVLVPGQECPRTHSNGFGHTISLNTRSMVRDVNKYWLYDWVADTVHAQGGLFGYAHAWIKHPYTRRGMSLSAPRHKVDFAEIMQIGQIGTEFYYDFLNLGFKLTAAAGTDVPWQGTIGEVRMYASIGEQPFSADAWFEAVRRGRTFVSNGPMIEFHVDEAMPGDEIVADSPRTLRVRARAWGDRAVMTPTQLAIIRHGDVIQTATPASSEQEALSIDLEVPTGDGFWIAARADGSDGSVAHTTPVYVIRPPLRFWKSSAVDDLIAQRLANLDDAQQLIERAKREYDQVNAQERYGLKLMREQAAELAERIAQARRFWEQLKADAERERPMRTAGASRP